MKFGGTRYGKSSLLFSTFILTSLLFAHLAHAKKANSQDGSSNPAETRSLSTDDRLPLVLPAGVSTSDVAKWVGATAAGLANMEKSDPGFSCPLLPALPANFNDIKATVENFATTLRSLDSCYSDSDRPAMNNNIEAITQAAQGLAGNAQKIYAFQSAGSQGAGAQGLSQSEVLDAITSAGNQVTTLGAGVSTAISSIKKLMDDKKCLDEGHSQFIGRIASDLGNVMTSAVPLLNAAQSIPGGDAVLMGFPAARAVLAGVGFGTEALGTAINLAGQFYTSEHAYDMADPDQEKALINSLCEYYRLRVRSQDILAQDQKAEYSGLGADATTTSDTPGNVHSLNAFRDTLQNMIASLNKSSGLDGGAMAKRKFRLTDFSHRIEIETERKTLLAKWSSTTQDNMAETITQISQQLDNAWINLSKPLEAWITARNQMIQNKQGSFCDATNALAGYSSAVNLGYGWRCSDPTHDEWAALMTLEPNADEDAKLRVCSYLSADLYNWSEYRAATLSAASVCSVVNTLVLNYHSPVNHGGAIQETCLVAADSRTGDAWGGSSKIAKMVGQMRELEGVGFSRLYKMEQSLSCSSN